MKKIVIREKHKNWRGKTVKTDTPLGIYILSQIVTFPIKAILWLVEVPFRLLSTSTKKKK